MRKEKPVKEETADPDEIVLPVVFYATRETHYTVIQEWKNGVPVKGDYKRWNTHEWLSERDVEYIFQSYVDSLVNEGHSARSPGLVDGSLAMVEVVDNAGNIVRRIYEVPESVMYPNRNELDLEVDERYKQCNLLALR